MSKKLKFSVKQSVIKDNFSESLEKLHIKYIEHIQKTDEYVSATNKKLYLRELLIKRYNVDEYIVDELIEITTDLTSLEFEYINYHIPELFLNAQ